MIKKTLTRFSTRLLLALPALLVATQANAHSGGHMELSSSQILSHMLASPYHTGIMVAGFIAVAFIVLKVSHINPSD